MITLFDKKSNEYRNIFNSKQASFYMEKVSVDLFATASFYILDDEVSNNYTVEATIISDSGLYKHFTTDGTELTTQDNNVMTLTPTVVDGHNVYIINILWKVDSYTLDQSDLNIKILDGSTEIDNVTIKLYSESVEAESRYDALLSNFKIYVDESFAKAFRDSNVNEAYVNHELVNRKKLELLNNMHELDEYIGCYRGLVDSVKIFGYDEDIIINEYWRWYNEELEQYEYQLHNIDKDYSVDKLKSLEGFERSNMIDLTFNINTHSDDIIENTRITKLITVHDSLVTARTKIHSIKNILEKYFLPANVYINEVIQNKFHITNIREYNNIQSLKTTYKDTNITKFLTHEWISEPIIRNRTYLSFELLNDSSEMQSNRIDQIVARTELSPYNNEHIFSNVDLTQYDLSDNTDFSTIFQQKYVRHSTSLFQFRLSNDTASQTLIDENIVTLECFVIDDDHNTVYELSIYSSNFGGSDTIPTELQLSIDKVGKYTIAIHLIDKFGIAHQYSNDIEVTMIDTSVNVYAPALPVDDLSIDIEYSTFGQMNKQIYQYEEYKTANFIGQYEMFQSGKVSEGGNPVYNSTVINNYDWNVYPNISGGNIIHRTGEVTRIHFDPPTIYEMRDMRIDTSRNLVRTYNGSYIQWIFDIGYEGTAKSFDLEIGHVNNVNSLVSIAVNYAGHVDDNTDYIYLKSLASELNNREDDLFADFTWSVFEMNFPNETTRYVLGGKSKQMQSPVIYDVGQATKDNIGWKLVRNATYVDQVPYVITDAISSVTTGEFTYEVDGVTETYGLDTTNLNSIIDELNRLEHFDAYLVDDTDGDAVATRIMVSAPNSSYFKITHPMIGTISSVFRETSIGKMIEVPHGYDTSIYEPIAISIDETVSYMPMNVRWIVEDENDETILTSTEYVLKFWTKLKRHESKSTYNVTAIWEDKYGNEYTKKYDSIIIVWRRLVDTKYNNDITTPLIPIVDTPPAQTRSMWSIDTGIPSSSPPPVPVWYLVQPTYTQVEVTQELIASSGGVVTNQLLYIPENTSASAWVVNSGVWVDAGIWVDEAVWQEPEE